MPSLRQKVTTYFRQLSFIAEPRDVNRHLSSLSPRKTDNGNFITKYLEGRMEDVFLPGPDIKHAQDPNDLPDLAVAFYPTGPHTVTGACTGPDEGLTGIKRSKLHLSAGSDIDFIDTNLEQDLEIRRSTGNQKQKFNPQKYRSDQNANKTSTRSRKNSRVEEPALENATSKDSNEASMMNKRNSVEENSTKTEFSEISTSLALNPNVDTTIEKDFVFVHDCSKDNSKKSIFGERDSNKTGVPSQSIEPIAGVTNWKSETEHAFGLSVSLYEKNFITNEPMGSPIADCYGTVVRGNSAVLALADGVNWGEGARLAARSAIHGSLEYLDTAVFGVVQGGTTTSTNSIFVSLLRSFWEAHACILEVGGALSTLTVSVVLPLSGDNLGKYVVCACNVGDSLGYVYSKKHGVREFTQGSHDITSMRDMRDAQGALGPVDGNKPELSNLTLSMTIVEPGDIVFLTSDGISDNFDPVVGKFAEAYFPDTFGNAIEPQLASKRQNKSASALYPRSSNIKEPKSRESPSTSSKSSQKVFTPATSTEQPIRPPRTKKSQLQTHSHVASSSSVPSRPKYMRSHTVIEPRVALTKSTTALKVRRSAAGLPFVTGPQRHKLTLLRLEDLLSYGINGTLRPCPSAKNLCHLLVDFVKMITSARRKVLEQRELFYKTVVGHDGVRREVELTRVQHRAARKRIVDGPMFASLPGKLDHASVVAFTVGSGLQPKEFTETSF